MITPPLWSSHSHEQDGVCTVSLAGELDFAGSGDLGHVLTGALDRPGIIAVVADLADVTFLDSAALGALIAVYQHARQVSRRFTVTRPIPGVRRILEITGVFDLFTGRPPA